jgi:hypothetical protein
MTRGVYRSGCGTVFSITPGGAEKVIHAFQAGSGLCGTVFRMNTDGTKTVLYDFAGALDGSRPD